MYRLAAGTAMLAHFGFVAFVVTGGFLAWAVPWVIWPHAFCVVWGAWVMGCSGRCPLTEVENWGRIGLGRHPLDEAGFVAHYLDGRLYPVPWSRRVQLAAFTLVLVSWLGLYLRR